MKYFLYSTIVLFIISIILYVVLSRSQLSIIYSQWFMYLGIISLLVLIVGIEIMVLKGGIPRITTLSSKITLGITVIIFLFLVLYDVNAFILDGFGFSKVTTTTQLQGVNIESQGTLGSQFLGLIIEGSVRNVETGEIYEFDINDPNVADLTSLFNSNQSSLPVTLPYQESNSQTMTYDITFLPHSKIILSAKLIQNNQTK
jgi:hypothetical protein